MKFRYKRITPSIIRPIITIEISHQDKTLPHEVLIDSGADICILGSEIGKHLGIDIENGEPRTLGGITGKPETFYFHMVTFQIGKWKHKAMTGFMPVINTQDYGILGQIGFFDHYCVKFDLNKQEIELKQSFNPRLN